MSEAGSAALTYGGLKAWDADGKVVQARFAEDKSGLGVVVDDSNARYPITIDPIAQQAYLKASNTEWGDGFGGSVAVSGDTVLVATPNEASGATGINGNQADNSVETSGAAYVFVRNGTTWSQQAYLKGDGTNSGTFGESVAISGDIVAVGARGEGKTHIFVRSGTTWAQQAFLTTSSTDDDLFGYSVSVSDHTVLVSAAFEASSATGVNGNQADNSAPYSGAAYVFDGLGKYSLSASGTLGSVAGSGIYLAGITANLTATPDPGYVFSAWSGDATGTVNPLSVLMDADKTITANFAPDINDDDNDGLTNYQEIVVYGTNPTLRDTDGDGFLDGYEVLTGKSPLDIADHPALVAEARTAIEFTFPATLGKTYRIEDSPDLGTWTTVESGIAGNGAVIQRFYTTRNMAMRYFRVEEDGP